MSTGVPLVLRCPKCRRGQYGYARVVRGARADKTKMRVRWLGRFLRRQCEATCLDCGHLWWTTLYNAELRRSLP